MSSKFREIEIKPGYIGDALKTKFLRVPPRQRDYSWKEKHVRELFNDLKDAVTAATKEYFLGSIVVTKQDDDGGDIPSVVDGQQRLATALILIAAIRDYLDAKTDGEARKLESMFLLSPVLGEADAPRLTLNDHDRDYFTQRILLPTSDAKRAQVEAVRPKKPSHILIDEAGKKAKEHVKILVKGLSHDVAKTQLLNQVKFLESKTVVIWVEVPDSRYAYTIFETMNDRGLDLSASDLIKNLLFHLADDQVEQAERQWAAMVGILESVQEPEIVKDFIRHYWVSRNGPIRTPELFADIKKSKTNKTTGMELLANFHESAGKYVALLNPMHGFWEGYTERSRKNIATLIQLNLKQARPLLLTVVEKFSKHEIEKVLRLAVSWSVRFLVSGELGSGALESEYAKHAQAIVAGTITDARSLAFAMATMVPADDAFKTDFAKVQVAKSSTARYYLRGLERQKSGELEPENIPNDDQLEITLEHILPEEPELGEWTRFGAEDRQRLTTRLGNMCLLKRTPNSFSRSAEFLTKKPFYKDSTYALTNELGRVHTTANVC